MKLHIFHTSDFHGKLNLAKARFLAELRRAHSPNLYFDTGDLVRSGNLGFSATADPGWALLHQADCDASVPGNRESHPIPTAFQSKLRGAKHPVLCANVRYKDGHPFLPASTAFEVGGLRVAVLGVMVPMVTRSMASSVASGLLWDAPLPAAQAQVEILRGESDLLIALTHIGLAADRELAAAEPRIDLILGGHTHALLETPERIGQVPISHVGSHGRFVRRLVWEPGQGVTSAEVLSLPE